MVDGKVARASRVLQRGNAVHITLPEAEPPRQFLPNPIPLTVVYEDDDLAVIDKPAGLVVHPAPGHWDDTLVNALVARGTTLVGGAAGRPGIVHRLDRDTSGLLVVAKTDLAHRRLTHALSARRIKRTYAALAWGHLARDTQTIDEPIGRHPRDRKRMTVRPEGKQARTEIHRIARFDVADLLHITLVTGRTHQIRVHLSHVGHPVVGDPVYHGGGSRRVTTGRRDIAVALDRATPRQALHAAALELTHPITGQLLALQSEWPLDLREALLICSDAPDRIAVEEPLRYLRFFTT